MNKLVEWVADNRKQFIILVSLGLATIIMTGIVYYSGKPLLTRFFGPVNPLAAVTVVTFAGFILLSFLLYRDWFSIFKAMKAGEWLLLIGFTGLFGIIIIIIDLIIIFPADTNIPFPVSLLFYPTIGFFAEMLFHVIPLAIILIILTSLFKQNSFQKTLWTGILLVAVIEPVYHVMNMRSSGLYSSPALAITGLHIFLFNLYQLFVFKKHGFIAMFTVRLIYYLLWHIAWGYFRLEILFE